MIVVMQKGEIVQGGAPAEILARPSNDFVRDFVGGADAMMKLLEFRTVGSVMRNSADGSGDRVRASDTLRAALTKMVKSGRTVLPVQEESGAIAGSIHVEDILAASKQ
jgi:osmoprotectant transport system ATP-binding protein